MTMLTPAAPREVPSPVIGLLSTSVGRGPGGSCRPAQRSARPPWPHHAYLHVAQALQEARSGPRRGLQSSRHLPAAGRRGQDTLSRPFLGAMNSHTGGLWPGASASGLKAVHMGEPQPQPWAHVGSLTHGGRNSASHQGVKEGRASWIVAPQGHGSLEPLAGALPSHGPARGSPRSCAQTPR